MDVRLELKKWKADFVLLETKEQKAEYDKRFKAFLASLSPAERKEFAQAYKEGAKEAIDEAKKISKIVDRKQKPYTWIRFYVIYCRALFREVSPMVVSTYKWQYCKR